MARKRGKVPQKKKKKTKEEAEEKEEEIFVEALRKVRVSYNHITYFKGYVLPSQRPIFP
jgi:hypothetical protein